MSGEVSPLASIPLITRNMTLPNLRKFSYLLIENIFKFIFLQSRTCSLLGLQQTCRLAQLIQFQMFEGLKSAINQENKRKISVNQRYLNNDSSLDESGSNNSEDSFENELNNRIEVFNVLTKDDSRYKERPSHHHYERDYLKKHHKQMELLEEKIKINEEMHQRQIQYISEKYEREIKALQLQLEKNQFAAKRHSKEEGLLQGLRKDNKRIIELHEEDQRIIERLNSQVSILKRENLQLRLAIKKKEEAEAEMQISQGTESEKQSKLQRQIDYLLREKQAQGQRKKQMEVTIQKLKAQNGELERQIDRVRHQSQQEVSVVSEKYKAQLQKLEEDYAEIKKRNQHIEDSFIDHLTQTSLNLQQNLKTIPERTMRNNSSLYLQESPIRTRSKDRQMQQQRRNDAQDPEKKAECKCSAQVQKLRGKLQQANGKIVELLRQKCEGKRRK